KIKDARVHCAVLKLPTIPPPTHAHTRASQQAAPPNNQPKGSLPGSPTVCPTTEAHTGTPAAEVVTDVPPMSNHPTHIRRRHGTLTPPTPQQGQRVSCSLERR